MTRSSLLTGAGLVAVLATPGGLHGQLRPLQHSPDSPITIPRLPGEIVLDGVVDEAAWDELAPFDMYMYQPNFGGALTERTEVWVAHDDSYLYVAGRMWDSDPDGIRTGTFYRDQYSGDDILSVIIDSYNDYETAVWFTVNPSGVRQDRTISNDAEFTNGMPMSWDWNSYWDVVTTQTEEGWFAEFRIPFSTLGFQVTGNEVEMGLILYPRGGPQERASDLSADRAQVGTPGVRQAIESATRGAPRRTAVRAGVPDPVYARRLQAESGARRAARRAAGRMAQRARSHYRAGARPQVFAHLEPRARSHAQHRLRAGRRPTTSRST